MQAGVTKLLLRPLWPAQRSDTCNAKQDRDDKISKCNERKERFGSFSY